MSADNESIDRRDVDRKEIFRVLRDRWMAANEGATQVELAAKIGSRKQALHGYGSPTDKRTAPWWVLFWLSEQLDLEIRITAQGTVISKKRHPEDGTLIPHLQPPGE